MLRVFKQSSFKNPTTFLKHRCDHFCKWFIVFHDPLKSLHLTVHRSRGPQPLSVRTEIESSPGPIMLPSWTAVKTNWIIKDFSADSKRFEGRKKKKYIEELALKVWPVKRNYLWTSSNQTLLSSTVESLRLPQGVGLNEE